MTYDFEPEARRRLNEVLSERYPSVCLYGAADTRDSIYYLEAICRLLEEYQAFRREVSEVCRHLPNRPFVLDRFVLPKPVDPLVEALKECGFATPGGIKEVFAKNLRAALAAHGLKIVEVE